MGGGGGRLPGQYMGWWGDIGSPPQKGVTTYSLSLNRQNVYAGMWHNAVFNTFRRTKNQIAYLIPPILIGYYTMQWAVHRNEYLNSKQGRAEHGDEV